MRPAIKLSLAGDKEFLRLRLIATMGDRNSHAHPHSNVAELLDLLFNIPEPPFHVATGNGIAKRFPLVALLIDYQVQVFGKKRATASFTTYQSAIHNGTCLGIPSGEATTKSWTNRIERTQIIPYVRWGSAMFSVPR